MTAVGVVTCDVPPASGSNLRTPNVWSSQVELNWNDNSAHETGLSVEISTHGDDWQVSRQVEANRTSVRASGLTLTEATGSASSRRSELRRKQDSMRYQVDAMRVTVRPGSRELWRTSF